MIGETNKGKTYILNLLTNNKLESGIELGAKAVTLILEDGIDIAMNKINVKI